MDYSAERRSPALAWAIDPIVVLRRIRQFEKAGQRLGKRAHPANFTGEEMQYYKVFYTDRPLPDGAQPDFSMVLPLEFGSEEDALKEAFKLIFRGAIVWKIDGPEGFRLDRAEIERRYQIFRTT